MLSSIPLATNNDTVKTILSDNTTTSDTLFEPKQSQSPVVLDIPTFQQQEVIITPPITTTLNSEKMSLQSSYSKEMSDKLDSLAQDVQAETEFVVKKSESIIQDFKNAIDESESDPEADSPKCSASLLLEKFKNSLISYYSSSTSFVKSTYSNKLIPAINKSSDFTKLKYQEVVNSLKEHPLFSYNLLYLTTLSVLSTSAYFIHKNYLTTMNCTNCHNANKPLHLFASIGLGLLVMGGGNFYYLKKSKKD